MRKDRRDTQRERLLAAMVKLVAEGGSGNATVTRVVADAGVTRSTFYAHFVDGEDCFLAALNATQQTLLAEVEHAVNEQAPERAAGAAVGALLGFADSHPAQARFSIDAALAGGPRLLAARDWAIAKIDRIVMDAYQQVPASTAIPDVSTAMLLGAVGRLLASRLRRGERGHGMLLDDLLGWIDSYAEPLGEHRWRTLRPGPTPARSPSLPAVPLSAPPAIPRGRPRRSGTRVAENQRQRILFATAEVVRRKGYRSATVAEITRLAGLDGRVFYRLFAGKEAAFMAVQELSFRRTMAVTAGAFFSVGNWPDCVWEAGRAFTQFVDQNRTLTHASLIESHAAGPLALKRLEDRARAFTIFLQPGYAHEPRLDEPSPLALEAIAAMSFEIAYRQARSDGNAAVARFLPQLAYISLAPFLGSTAANAVIDAQLEAELRT
jgi:AcrR family transcriptional regulator